MNEETTPADLDPFKNWMSYDPGPKMGSWRQLYERTILQALEKEKKLKEIEDFLHSDQSRFCEDCEATKCYGSLYPICEPVLEKLRGML